MSTILIASATLGNWSENIVKAIYAFRHGHIPSLQIRGVELAFAFSHYDTTEDIFQGHLALCKVLLGVSDVLPSYQRRPMTPLGEETVKHLAELLRSGEEKRGVDMSLFEGANDICKIVADNLVGDEIINP